MLQQDFPNTSKMLGGKSEVEEQVFTSENWFSCKVIANLHKGHFTWRKSDRGSWGAFYLAKTMIDYS